MDRLEAKKMNCYFCGGGVELRKVDHVHKWAGKIYLFKGVSAEVCTQCGETYFDSVELEKMDVLVTSARQPQQTLSIPVFLL